MAETRPKRRCGFLKAAAAAVMGVVALTYVRFGADVSSTFSRIDYVMDVTNNHDYPIIRVAHLVDVRTPLGSWYIHYTYSEGDGWSARTISSGCIRVRFNTPSHWHPFFSMWRIDSPKCFPI
ncbi:MAG: hypothetical protein OXK78_19400 [Caldilineaceae bacterium]|nr:hypothetical protein [Caldilineaceae bacterium]